VQELFALLESFGLNRRQGLNRKLSQFGSRNVVRLLEALAEFQSAPSSVKPGRLVFYPAGGRMGLGAGERSVRSSLLLADHIALPNTLRHHAAWTLQGIDREKVDAGILGRLHPYLFQLFLLKPLFDSHLASLIDVRSAPVSVIHPLANALRHEFLRWITYGVDALGTPLFLMTLGGRHYFANTALSSMGTEMFVHPPPESTDAIIQIGPLTTEGRFEPRDPSALLSGVHPLAQQFEEFISVELFRAQMLAEGAARAGASLMTDSDDDWCILRLFGTTDSNAHILGPESVLAETLSEDLPFIADVPVDALVRLRAETEAGFDNFRSLLLKGAAKVGNVTDPTKRYAAAHTFVVEELQPEYARYRSLVNGARRERAGSIVGGVGVIALAVVLAALGNDPRLAGAATTSIPFFNRLLDAQRRLDESESDAVSFLWKVERSV
jgi:hypothetical protein